MSARVYKNHAKRKFQRDSAVDTSMNMNAKMFLKLINAVRDVQEILFVGINATKCANLIVMKFIHQILKKGISHLAKNLS